MDADILVAAARRAADTTVNCLVAFTTTGGTANRMARERPLQPVLALTPNPAVAHRLTLTWGLEARVAIEPNSLEGVTKEAVDMAVRLGLAGPPAAASSSSAARPSARGGRRICCAWPMRRCGCAGRRGGGRGARSQRSRRSHWVSPLIGIGSTGKIDQVGL